MLNDKFNEMKSIICNEIDRMETDKVLIENLDKKCKHLKFIVDYINLLIQEKEIDELEVYGLLYIIECDLKCVFFNNEKMIDDIYKKIKENVNLINNSKNNNTINSNYEKQKGTKCIESVKNFLNRELEKNSKELEKYKKSYNLEVLIDLKRIMSMFKFQQKIGKKQILSFAEMCEMSNININDRVRYIEIMRMHNISIFNNMKNYYDVDKTQLLCMLDDEIPEISKIYIENSSDKSKYDSYYDMYINLITEVTKDNYNIEECALKLEEIFDLRPVLEENPNMEEFTYITEKILEYYKNEMEKLKEIIHDVDFYLNSEIKANIVSEYNKYRAMFNRMRFIRNDQILRRNKMDIVKCNEIEAVNEIYFSCKNEDLTYFESDLKEVPPENYDKILLLLAKLKTNTLSNNDYKLLVSNKKLKGCLELKRDQVRIIYRHLNDNKYIIIGVGLKKDDIDLHFYNKMADRKYNKYYTKTDKEETIKEYIKLKKRKGNR